MKKVYDVEARYKEDKHFFGEVEIDVEYEAEAESKATIAARDWLAKQLRGEGIMDRDDRLGLPEGRWWSIYTARGNGYSIHGRVWMDIEEA